MLQRFALWLAIVAVVGTACAPALKDLKPSLSATDTGTIWFASAGSLVRSSDESHFVTGPPVVLSGHLALPELAELLR
jgi:hypothetical protein